jgi:rhamnosyltransferase
MSKIIDCVIPTYHPTERFLELLSMLGDQSLSIRRVHVINTDKEGFTALLQHTGMSEAELAARYPFTDVEHINPSEFDHGGTRNRGVFKCAGADYVLLMTQDALPCDRELTGKLAEPLDEDAGIIASYARQVANPNATAVERYSRAFNYPEESLTKSQADFERLGIRTYFCSNVCAMYRKEALNKLSGFPEHMIFNEDMVFAGRAMQGGWRIAYAADARVYHSHNYGPIQQFRRNFDLGVSQAMHPEIFSGAKSEGEGVRYVKAVLRMLREQKALGEAPGFLLTCGFRLMGYRLGKNYRKLPKGLVRTFSSNRHFWDRHSEQEI